MRLAGNLMYLSTAEIASKVVTFAAISYLARVLGPVAYGYVEFAGSVLLCAGLIVDQGFGPYGAREIAKSPNRTSELFSEIVLARFLLAALAYAAVLGFAFLLDRSPDLTRLFVIYGLSLLGMPLLLQWVFQGHDQMVVVAVVQVLRQTVYAIVVFAFVRSQAQIWFVAIAEVAGVGCAGLYGLWMYQRRFKNGLRSRPRISKQLFREGVPIGLSQVFWMVRMYGATVVMGLIASPRDVGFFGAAMRILIALHAFVYLYYFNLLPLLSRTWQERSERFGEVISQSLRITAWVGPGAGILWVLTAPIVVTVVFGPAFTSATLALQWLAGVAVVAALSGHYRFALIAAGRQTTEMMAQACGAFVAVVLVPVGYAAAGPGGAASVLVLAELVVWGITWWWARRRLGLKNHLSLLVRPSVALVCITGLLFLLPSVLIVRLVLVPVLLVVLALTVDTALRQYACNVLFLGRQFRRQVADHTPEIKHEYSPRPDLAQAPAPLASNLKSNAIVQSNNRPQRSP